VFAVEGGGAVVELGYDRLLREVRERGRVSGGRGKGYAYIHAYVRINMQQYIVNMCHRHPPTHHIISNLLGLRLDTSRVPSAKGREGG